MYVQLGVIECLPTLAKVGKSTFVEHFLETSINYLLHFSSNAKNHNDRSLGYSTLA